VFTYCSHCVQAEAGAESMAAEHHLTFGPFRLDLAQGRLWRGAE